MCFELRRHQVCGLGPGQHAVVLRHALGPVAMAIEDLTPAAFRSLGDYWSDKHRGIDYASATSALEMAIWDLEA